MSLAPIVLFAYNRPEHTLQTLQALSQNDLADKSILYIYADGPKKDANNETILLIEKVRRIIKSRNWCGQVNIIESLENKGLANSIIEGVTNVVNKHGKIIVLEDDIVTAPGFLRFMNRALDVYESNEKVMHISGFMYPNEKTLPDTFFFNVPLCWGWATWASAWKSLNTDVEFLVNYFEKANRWEEFNKFGDKHLERQLRENLSKRMHTWFIKWHASILINEGYCLFPGRSLVNNIGFDNSGVHCDSTDIFENKNLDQNILVEPIPLEEYGVADKIIKNLYKEISVNKNSLFKKIKNSALMAGAIATRPFRKVFRKIIVKLIPELQVLENDQASLATIRSSSKRSRIGKHVRLSDPYRLLHVNIGDYSYVGSNCNISFAEIGKFVSIGPNFLCGWGIHPINGISTHPMFYSVEKQNGMTLSDRNKIQERKNIYIGNDVFIGANVTILDGVTIGDGAVIGAGAVVSKNIPPYAVAVGAPIRIIKYRFTEEQIEDLLEIKWWDFEEERLKEIEQQFFELDDFINSNKRERKHPDQWDVQQD